MTSLNHPAQAMLLALALVFSTAVSAKLATPTPEQQKAEAEKKAVADAKAEQDKKQLAAAMERLAQRWRQRAESQGWPVSEPTPVAAVPAFTAEAKNAGGNQGPGNEGPVRSEKRGTAPASEDAKKDKPVEHGDRLPSRIYSDGKVIDQEDRAVTKDPTAPK